MSVNNERTCVITNGDSYLGFAIAYRMLQGKMKGERYYSTGGRICVFCRNCSGYDLSILQEMGAIVIEVNYEDEEMLCKALKNAYVVSIIPEHSHNTLKEAECMIKACKRQNVEFLCMHSIVGVDRISKQGSSNEQQEYRHLKQIYKIEEKVRETYPEKHGIIRHSIFNQFLYFMAPQIENENVVALPAKENANWGSVDVNDVLNAICMLAKEHEKRTDSTSLHKKLYQFTPSRIMTSKENVHEIAKGLERAEIKYVEISESEMKKYLHRMKDDSRFKEHQGHHEGGSWDHDGRWSIPIGKYLNDCAIEMIIEIWSMINAGKQDLRTNDLKMVLNTEPRTLKEYFKKNRSQFHQFK
ncbi:hypothetical protein G6F43_002023 [Rhizopus delemar]|nr:hypothetical protein G6F43_002023 [Rhizopus delemar]